MPPGQPTVIEAEEIGSPGKDHPDRNRDQTGGDTFRVPETAEPAHQDYREAVRPITGVMYISSAGRMEMKVIDTPANGRATRRAA